VTTPKKIVSLNKRARFDYFIEDNVEAGIMLQGSEVKSLRNGQGSITEAYASDEGGDELFLINSFIPEYSEASSFNHNPRRSRKLLLRRKEISRLLGKVRKKGVTLIPLSLYFNQRGIAKLDLGIATGKKQTDKRQTEKDRDWKREKARILKNKG
jgi:SsrA-binding protein